MTNLQKNRILFTKYLHMSEKMCIFAVDNVEKQTINYIYNFKISYRMKKFLLTLVAVFTAISMFGQERLTIYFADESGTQVGRQVTATLGEAFTAPHLVFEPAEAQRSVRVEYGSTNPDAAEIDMTSGRITLKAAGTTTISAVTGETGEYYSARAQYNLIVEAAQDTTPVVPATCPEARFYSNGAEVKTLSVKVGEAVSVPMLLSAEGGILSGGRMIIDSTNIAIITEDNMIYGKAEGYATLTVMIYKSSSAAGGVLTCEYQLPIIVEAAAPQKLDPELSLDVKEISIELGEAVTTPKIINPNNIDLNPSNGKWYNNWNSKVASVNEETGEVTILGVGTDTIYFEFTGNDTYKGTILSYQIHVTTTGLVVGGVTVMNSNCKDILNDGGSITYDPITHTLTMTNALLSGTGVETGIRYTDDIPLNIVLVGSNVITNVDAAIHSEWAAVYMRAEEYGSIRMTATTVCIKAPMLKISNCSVTAYGNAAGLATSRLSVARGANIVADGSVAIQAQEFIKAEDNNGEGIDILTAGVTFEPKKGFYKDGKYATHVEIGKVVVVPAATEVTTIDFTQTDPDGDQTVIFSTSATDTYNESTGQLEITTTLTEAQVETAMETLVPGSSEWMAYLPGSLIFDIPTGEGKVKVLCNTVPGYSLEVKLEGKAAVSITQINLEWAEVAYNVTEPLHVVIYLRASDPASAPARIAKDDDPTVGAYIQAVKIAPKDTPDPNPTTDIEQTNEPASNSNYKMLKNGQLFIVRDGKTFTASGIEIR